jgi:hypothetical protein
MGPERSGFGITKLLSKLIRSHLFLVQKSPGRSSQGERGNGTARVISAQYSSEYF